MFNGILRLIIWIIASVDTGEFSNIPTKGPLIIIFNHVNFLEVPLLYLRLLPRKVHYMAKKETWDTPLGGWVATNWKAIPVIRGGDPSRAIHEAEACLKRGEIILMSPEGTRSEDGIMRQGRAGAAVLALETGTALLPVAHFGAEKIKGNLQRFQRTRVTYRVGNDFKLKGSRHPDRDERMVQATVMMSKLAALLPEEYRGVYLPGK